MKINETDLKQLIDSSIKTKQTQEKKPEGNNFQEVFKKTISTANNQIGNSQEVLNNATVTMDKTVDFQSIQTTALTVAEEALALIEHFSNNINEANINDSILNTLAETMDNKVEDLKILRDGLDFSDPLRENIDAIGSLTVVEAAKIRRGYY